MMPGSGSIGSSPKLEAIAGLEVDVCELKGCDLETVLATPVNERCGEVRSYLRPAVRR